MKSTGVIRGLVLLAALAVTGAAVGASSAVTWSGRLTDPPSPDAWPVSAFPLATLVVGSGSIEARFTGLTQAAHDAQDARSTCSMRFRFVRSEGGWRYYVASGAARLIGTSTGGLPDLSPCSEQDRSWSGALRVRPAGAKLKVEFAQLYKGPGKPFYIALQGYLHR